MSCEEAFANLGRKIDDAWYALTHWRKTSVRSGPTIRDRVGQGVQAAQHWVYDQSEKLQAARQDMNPRTRTVLLVASAMLLGGVGVWAGMRYLGTGESRLTGEEIRALERLRSPGGAASMFAAPVGEARAEPVQTGNRSSTQPVPPSSTFFPPPR